MNNKTHKYVLTTHFSDIIEFLPQISLLEKQNIIVTLNNPVYSTSIPFS